MTVMTPALGRMVADGGAFAALTSSSTSASDSDLPQFIECSSPAVTRVKGRCTADVQRVRMRLSINSLSGSDLDGSEVFDTEDRSVSSLADRSVGWL